MKKLYIIAGCNGAGKTTASYTILPEILACDEFVNADEIAKGLSPFKPEKTGIQAGRLMLERIKTLVQSELDFAFETTLSTRSYKNFVLDAQKNGFSVTLLFFWLSSQNLAIKRVETRVKEGGHNIPENVIRRRYENGLKNFFTIFKELVDDWMFIDNSGEPYQIIAAGAKEDEEIGNAEIWNNLNIMDKKTELKDKRKKIVEGLEKSYQKLVEFKHYKKSPLIITKNGEILEIAPEKILPTTPYISKFNE